jgi:pilus assembly protein CpaB
LKRSNRLILLIGLFLAAIAFVGIIVVLGQGGGGNNGDGGTGRNETTYVVAAVDIPLATTVTAEMVETKTVSETDKPTDAYTLASDAIGQTTTTEVLKGQKIGPQTFSTTTVNADIGRLLETGRRAMPVAVDQVSGVGTLIKPGDRVDVVIGITGADKFPVVTTDPQTDQVSIVPGINATSVKAIIQNLEVVGSLLPPPPTDENGNPTTTEGAPPSLNGQTELVILAVSAQEAEVLRFGQIDGTITLILRSPDDAEAPAEETTGITLRELVDKWAVIPPQVVETVLPK